MSIQIPHDHVLKIPFMLSSFAQQGYAANFVGQNLTPLIRYGSGNAVKHELFSFTPNCLYFHMSISPLSKLSISSVQKYVLHQIFALSPPPQLKLFSSILIKTNIFLIFLDGKCAFIVYLQAVKTVQNSTNANANYMCPSLGKLQVHMHNLSILN